MLKIVLSLAVSLVVLAQNPQPCTAPQAFESRFSYYDPIRRIAVQASYHYDANNKRVQISERAMTPTGGLTFDLYFLYNLRSAPTAYRYNHNTSTCTSAVITEPWRPLSIPDAASYYTTITLGTNAFSHAGVDVSLWGLTTRDAQNRTAFQWEGQFTVTGCILVHEFMLNVTGNSFTQDTFYDTTIGIRNPAVFNPPAACQQNDIAMLKQPVGLRDRTSWVQDLIE